MDDHEQIIEKMKQCTLCELHKHRTQVVVGDYGPKNGICFIGEAPGYNEDVQGRPFVGRSGQLLDEMLSTIKLNRSDVSVLNINKCRPPDNRNPTKTEMHICGSTWLEKQLGYLHPILLVVLGSTALQYFLPDKRITRVRGQLQVRSSGPPILPLFHPAYVLRGAITIDEYKQDFQQLARLLDQMDDSQISSVGSNDQPNLDDFF